MPADAPRDADGPSGPGDQTHGQLGQLEAAVGIGQHRAGECRELDAGPDAGAVEPSDELGPERGQAQPRAAGAAHQVGQCGVRGEAELGEVASAREVGTCTPQRDRRQRGVTGGEVEGPTERVTHGRPDSISPLRSIEDELELVARASKLDELSTLGELVW